MATKVIAHRGASAGAPENTLAAFRLAFEQKADLLELDVQATIDGALVVFHDKTTTRWNNHDRPVAACSLAEMQALDIGGERVPTLDEVCALVRAQENAGVNIELKAEGTGTAVARVVAQHNLQRRVLISSFSLFALADMARADPNLPRAFLSGLDEAEQSSDWPLDTLAELGASAWHPHGRTPDLAARIARVRAAGYAVNVWTVNEPDDLRAALALGVDGIITDKPGLLRRILDEEIANTDV